MTTDAKRAPAAKSGAVHETVEIVKTIVYALLIAASRLVLLAHHPSDVVAGALIGVVGAMCVRYWFAARRIGFAVRRDGEIVPFRSVSGHPKRVAREPSAP